LISVGFEVKFVLLCHLHDRSWFLVVKRMFFASFLGLYWLNLFVLATDEDV